MASTLPPTSTKTASIATAFTRKLYRMLDVEDPAVVGWDATGLSFSIRDEEQLDENVLPRYFRGRVDVFRQHLSEHGFSAVTAMVDSKPVESFSHRYFVRGAPNQLSLIVRVPTNKRRRSRLGKKRAVTDTTLVSEIKCEDLCSALPSFVDSESFNLFEYLHETTTTTVPSVSTDAEPEPERKTDEELHNSLAQILALHATNPVIASKAMLDGDGEAERPVDFDQVDTPMFSFELMTSMVEWLDTTA